MNSSRLTKFRVGKVSASGVNRKLTSGNFGRTGLQLLSDLNETQLSDVVV